MEVGGARFRGARIVYAAAGSKHSGVVTSEGGVWTWGQGWLGKLGHNDQEDQLVPKEVEGEMGGGKAVMLAAGSAHTMVVTGDGALWGCGAGATVSWVWGTGWAGARRYGWGRRRLSGSRGC